MTWIDKLEIGLKEDAPFRKDNFPPSQVRGRNRRPARAGRQRFRSHVTTITRWQSRQLPTRRPGKPRTRRSRHV
jgi:hypothetical protein